MGNSKKPSADHDLLIRLEQKLDHLDTTLTDYISNNKATLEHIPDLQRDVKWVSKMVIGAYATIMTAAAGAAAAFFAK